MPIDQALVQACLLVEQVCLADLRRHLCGCAHCREHYGRKFAGEELARLCIEGEHLNRRLAVASRALREALRVPD